MVRLLSVILFSVSAMAADLVLEQLPVLTVDQNGNASATLTFRNTGTAEIPLNLKLSDFRHKRLDGKDYEVGSTPTLTLTPSVEKLKPNDQLQVKVTVTNLWEAQSQATLKNGDADVPVRDGPPNIVLQAVRIPATYNVQIVSPTPDNPEIHFIEDRALVGLKNSDPFNYRFKWKLRLNEQIYDGVEPNTIELVPGDVTWVSIRASKDMEFLKAGWLTAGTLKDDTFKGSLILDRVFEGDRVLQPVTSKDLPVTFRLSFWKGDWQAFWNGLWTFVLLAIGGAFSIWIRYVTPNYSGGLALRRRIFERRSKIEGMDAELDSRWRVLLWFHLDAIGQELSPPRRWYYPSPWFFPSFSATLVELNACLEMVHQWVEIAYGVAITLHRASAAIQKIPPRVFQWIQEKCLRALTPIESGFTTAEELAAMNADLKAAQQYLDATLSHSAISELEQEIVAREKRLKDLTGDLVKKYPEVANVIGRLDGPASQGTAPSPADYFERDLTSLRVDLLRIVDERKEELTVADSVTDDAKKSVAEALARLQAHLPNFVSYLVPGTHESLSMARVIVDEMRQDIYPDGLMNPESLMKTEVKKEPPALTIITIPEKIQLHRPVKMALRFNRPILNEAAGRQEWTCTWDFGDGEPGACGWEVFHSYNETGSFKGTVTIRDRDGNQVITFEPPRPFSVEGPSGEETGWIRKETKLELYRLLIPLIIALIGLITAARQQVQSLTFFEAVAAVAALGFGANAIKDLFTQRPAGS